MDDLIVEGVTKRYGQGSAIFSDLSHTFKAGTATGLVGPNGSGKTTLLRLLSATSFPTEGVIRYGDTNIHESPYNYLQHVGIVHDESALPRYVNAVELLEYALRSRGLWDAKSPDRITGILDTLDLDDRREQPIGTYSSGMFKKTQIALALVADPSVLLMDEPFRGLDQSSTKAAAELFRHHKEKGAILILASHRKDLLEGMCNNFLDLNSPPTKKS